jgi:hypothetical protein
MSLVHSCGGRVPHPDSLSLLLELELEELVAAETITDDCTNMIRATKTSAPTIFFIYIEVLFIAVVIIEK